MIFVFDSNSLIVIFRYYYADRFPSFWEKFHKLVENGEIISVREVFQEIKEVDDALLKWAKDNKQLFRESTDAELSIVASIFENKFFQDMVRKKERLKGSPVADPFVIARAEKRHAWVVTEEAKKPGRPDIPNVCEKRGIECTNLEGFMKEKKWKF